MDRVFDHQLSRRQLLKASAAGAIAAGMGPLAVTGVRAAGNGRLIPAGKVGTITFTQRDVPGRIGIAASAALGVAPTMGFLGGLTLSAVKRSLGAKDWGVMIEGHGGMLDRLDSVSFAAPVFLHLTRFFFT